MKKNTAKNTLKRICGNCGGNVDHMLSPLCEKCSFYKHDWIPTGDDIFEGLGKNKGLIFGRIKPTESVYYSRVMDSLT